jgi:hypothetical protein
MASDRDTITVTPAIHPLDSLALITGMMFDGTSIWVADINKQVVRLNASYAIAQPFHLDGISGLWPQGATTPSMSQTRKRSGRLPATAER